jgi:selT/selW/selH-like putative selenoprotein
VFEQYAAILHQKYPEISVEGDMYPPPDYKVLLARAMGAVKMLLIICILGSVNIFNFLGLQEPSWWTWCTRNKLYSCIMIFFVCNAVEGQLLSTGAFEISMNDIPLWSKLETGRIPQPPELFKIIENHMQFAA